MDSQILSTYKIYKTVKQIIKQSETNNQSKTNQTETNRKVRNKSSENIINNCEELQLKLKQEKL